MSQRSIQGTSFIYFTFNPFPLIGVFWCICSIQLLKTWWPKWNLLNEQFLLSSPCFQPYFIVKFSFKEICQSVVLYNFNVVCCRFVVWGKGLNQIVEMYKLIFIYTCENTLRLSVSQSTAPFFFMSTVKPRRIHQSS